MATDWMTPAELAQLTGKSPKRLAQYRSDRVGLPFHKIPETSIILYDRAEFDELVRSCRVETRDHWKAVA